MNIIKSYMKNINKLFTVLLSYLKKYLVQIQYATILLLLIIVIVLAKEHNNLRFNIRNNASRNTELVLEIKRLKEMKLQNETSKNNESIIFPDKENDQNESELRSYFTIAYPASSYSSAPIKSVLIEDEENKIVGRLDFDRELLVSLNQGSDIYNSSKKKDYVFFYLTKSDGVCNYPMHQEFMPSKEQTSECIQKRDSDFKEVGGLWLFDINENEFRRLLTNEEVNKKENYEISSSFDEVVENQDGTYTAKFKYRISGYERVNEIILNLED